MDTKIGLTSLSLLLVVCTLGAKTDNSIYCDKSEFECLKGQHVMCNLKIAWAPRCKSPILHNLTRAHRKQFQDGHNTRRNTAALGQLSGLFKNRTAADMAEMIWDDELEIYAQANLLRCEMEHDDCRSTKRHLYAGQNLAMTCGIWSTVEEAISGSMQMWWDEHKSITTIDDENMYTSVRSQGKYGHGHFTQMCRDKAFALGCAVISTDNGRCWYVTCDYAVTNWGYSPVYVRGDVRSKCNTYSSRYGGLCGKDEDYTGYVVKGIKFFTHAKNNAPIMRQWQQNGRRLNVSDAPRSRPNRRRSTQRRKQSNSNHGRHGNKKRPQKQMRNTPHIGHWRGSH